MNPGDGEGDDDYPVGYRKPPRHTQFQPGQSGNPKGRPKGTKNLKTHFLEELSERISVREGGLTRQISKLHALVKTLTNKALQGDAKSATLVLSMVSRFETSEPGEGSVLRDPEGREMFSVEEGRSYARHVYELALRFIPKEKYAEFFDVIEEDLARSASETLEICRKEEEILQ